MLRDDRLLAPLAALLDRLISDKDQRDQARQRLLALPGTAELVSLRTELTLALSAPIPDTWTTRARPCFLYVMYAILLGALPAGALAAFQPAMASAVAAGMSAYLNGIPSSLYTLFGTGYLGYTAARQWGKKLGTDR
ncbi:MAG: hypothetical protein KGJ57_06890 [Sphingomonadales bacterium]|nr:hypothetical protein [Sphingomonadales bacterium]MDE2169139.1 hypothetical protein [Sphingomonadales bacterium]